MPIPGPIPGYACQILLDDGTGTFPYDVTAFAREVEGFNWIRGRADELSDNQPGALTLTFDNTGGQFTVGNGTYNVACDQRIRLIYAPGTPSQRTRWTGAVQSWPVAWPTGDDTLSTVTATATDPLATLARRTLKPALQEEVLKASPAYYFPLNDAATASVALDLKGSGAALTPAGTGAAVKFSSGSSPLGGAGTGVTFAGGQYLRTSGEPLVGPVTMTMGCWFVNGAVPTGNTLLVTDNGTLFLGTGKQVVWNPGAGPLQIHPTVISDTTLVHSVTFVFDAFGATYLYVDGVSDGGTALGFSCPTKVTSVGGGDPLLASWVGSISDFAVFPADMRTSLTGLYNAGLDEPGETVAARVSRCAGYAGVTVGSLSTAGYTTLGPTAQSGRTALDVIQEAAAADLGSAFVNGSGGLSYVSGTDLASKVTADATVDASFCDPSTIFPVDMTSVVNYATGTSAGTGNTVGPVQDAVSINGDATHRAHGVYPQTYAWNVNSDAQALALTQWKVGVYAQPTPRCPTLKIDLLTMGDAAVRDKLLGLDLGSFLQVTGLPSQTPGGTTANLIVEGLKETVMIPLHSEAEWSLELNCAQRSLWDAFIPDDPVHGIPDSTAARAYI